MKRKILAVGGGGIGERHIRVLSGREDVELSVCDINPSLLDRLKHTYRIQNLYRLWNSVDLEQFDVVVISTPAHLHIPMMTDALTAGCHVLCEKPLALSAEGLDQVVRLLREKNKTAGIAYVYRSMPGPAFLRKRVISGEIGPIKNISIVVGSDYSFYRPDYKDIYYSDPGKGGGALHDAVSHMVNFIEWCMGPIDSIYCMARHLVLPGVEVEDTVGSVMTFTETDAICTLSLNQFQRTYGIQFEFCGTDGVLRFDGTTHSVGVCKDHCGEYIWSKPMNRTRDEYHQLQFDNFFKAIDNGEPFVCTLEEAEATMRTILAAHASVKKNMPVTVQHRTAMSGLIA